ncbi:divalent metal cation (Fe/Co/Zn/Cd) transporter [Paenibacillus cellulosilyticus]|uniref:Divalent metal cation (Fe/Co/Zn/Cd) transporter n=1 Tax=Paenibacillus cellulosilyticus TaxID=375489 RepID=A0A2V2YGP5_9BACL|nr:cation transporter dimerization domain-containing protein [Paenibacillus cellulosilyticus]PWV91991.1 divalent metal cation (Fe/Co/Zn/Cd) transporter [Paenibacillus cellulosilyticus]QKS46653.1 cation transporter [Paenibacillus cellulosilyticus]
MSANQLSDKRFSAMRAGIWGNGALALGKAAAALLSGSTALMADSIRSIANGAESLAYSFHIDGRSTTRMKNSESSGASAIIIVSAITLLLGVEIGLEAFRSWSSESSAVPDWTAAVFALIALVLKEWLVPAVGKQLLDRLASLVTVAGAGCAAIGDYANLPALEAADPIAAMFVALIVVYKGYGCLLQLTSNRRSMPLGHEEQVASIMEIVQRVEGVVTVESLRAREHGHYIVVHIVISVNPRISVLEGQEIAKRIKELIMKRFIHVTETSVYVEPYDPGYPYKSNHDPNQDHMPTLLQ